MSSSFNRGIWTAAYVAIVSSNLHWHYGHQKPMAWWVWLACGVCTLAAVGNVVEEWKK